VKLWLVDASVLLASEAADDANHADSLRVLRGEDAVATLDLARYEAANVAIVAWKDRAAARRLRGLVDALAEDGGVVRAESQLLEAAEELAITHGISVCDAAYVAAAGMVGASLVSCDVRDLVSRGLARTPAEVQATRS
jgi:predicted nucleic acid-binding protein